MKRLFFLTIVLTGVLITSCGGSSSSKAIRTDIDSLSYALGIEAGANARRFDSTLNVELLTQAIRDCFDKNQKMTLEQARSFIGYYYGVGRARRNDENSRKWLTEVVAKKKGVEKTASGLYYIINEPGSDRKLQTGDTVRTTYLMKTCEGAKLDAATADRPYSFVKGTNAVIPGFEEGLSLVGEGGKITLFMPWELAYGEMGTSGIPPKTALEYDIEVIDVWPVAQ